MGHDHSHGHGLAHSHAHQGPATGGAQTALVIAIALNTSFVVAEAIAGVLAQSTSLLADAAHNLSDVLGLGLAWGALRLATRAPTLRRTYGLRRATILAALGNALLLLVAVGGVLWESAERFLEAPEVHAPTVMIVAGIGVAINGASALALARHGRRDANMRGALLHLAADAAVSLAVVVTGAIIWWTGWRWVDPAMSLLVCVVVFASTVGLLRESTDLALDAVPRHVDPAQVMTYLRSLPGVQDVHDLHIWAMSTTEVALTAHLVMPWNEREPTFLRELEHALKDKFDIGHSTVQIDCAVNDAECALASADSV